jgi:hypothetical protein
LQATAIVWPQEMQLEFTNLHEKAVLLQILLSGRSPFGHHGHIGRENLSKILLAFLPFLSGQPILKHKNKVT